MLNNWHARGGFGSGYFSITKVYGSTLLALEEDGVSLRKSFSVLNSPDYYVQSPSVRDAWRHTLDLQETVICQSACHSGPQAPENCSWQSV